MAENLVRNVILESCVLGGLPLFPIGFFNAVQIEDVVPWVVLLFDVLVEVKIQIFKLII